MNKDLIALLNSIKNDDFLEFAKYFKSNANISFGRFPLLSLCYLYKAKKIIKLFKSHIIKIKKFDIKEEPIELYQKFRSVAGRCLRLYLEKNSIVSPIEMLAILGEDSQVKKVYKLYLNNNLLTEEIKQKLSKIYTISAQHLELSLYGIKISTKQLTKKEKFVLRLSIALSIICLMAFSGMLVLLTSTVGLGTSANPYKIYFASQLQNAMDTGGYYTLEQDIVLDGAIDVDFTGNLDGKGHTITINNIPTNALIKSNSGTIKNICLNYQDCRATINQSVGLFVGDNTGNLENITLIMNSLNLMCNKNSKDIYVTTISSNNNGNIINCIVDIGIEINTSGNGECFVGGIAGINAGVISGCVFSGDINTTEADASAIAVKNEYGGVLIKCKNKATIHQNSSLNGWSPNVAGIVLNNYGLVEKCINNGNLTVISSNDSENATGYIILGGISSNNYGKHIDCLNLGDLEAHSKKLMIYCGGISAYSSYWVINNSTIYSSIENCGTKGTIDIDIDNESGFAFGGGLCGFLYGTAQNCYSLSTFVQGYNENKYFFGTALGSAYASYNIFYGNYLVDLSLDNNYVLTDTNIPYQIGVLINNNQLVSLGVDLSSGINVTTESEILGSEVYFDA